MTILVRSAYRRLRRRVIVFVRNRVRLDEDDIRDSLVDGLRRDNEALAKALSNTCIVLNRLQDRILFYEEKVPAIAKGKKAYDKKLRKLIQAREKENAAAAALAADPERSP